MIQRIERSGPGGPLPRLAILCSTLAVVAAVVTGCSSTSGTAAPAPAAAASPVASSVSEEPSDLLTSESAAAPSAELEPPSPPSTQAETGAAAGDGTEGDCPLSSAEITASTGIAWEFQLHRPLGPSELDESIMSEVCIFTAPEVTSEYGTQGSCVPM